MSSLDLLPQLCSRCHKQKAANTGQLMWSKHKFHRKIFVCFACLEKPHVPRLMRKNDETPIEKEAREAIERTGEKAFAEYSMGAFIFDFVLPRRRLIIEIDSESYHSSGKAKRRDTQKDDWAKRNRWRLVRIRAPDIAQQIIHVISTRRADFNS